MPKVLDWQQDWPPATLACKHGNFDNLVKALEDGADPTLANPRGSTCLMICAVYGHVSSDENMLHVVLCLAALVTSPRRRSKCLNS